MTENNAADNLNIIEKSYKVRQTGKDGTSIETTIPREVFAREARKRGLTVAEGVKQLRAVWRYNSFDGLYLRFEPVKEG